MDMLDMHSMVSYLYVLYITSTYSFYGYPSQDALKLSGSAFDDIAISLGLRQSDIVSVLYGMT
jgi:hypothetical protein